MTTKIAIGEVLALMLPLLFVGCLSPAAEAVIEPYEPETVQTEYSNNSHQYWNINPMGMGNITEIALNGSGDVHFSLELTGFFHEPALWERGYVNYTVSQEDETLFSVQVNFTLEEKYNATWLNMSGNITIEIQSTGSDNPTDDKPGDYYIASSRFALKR
jgi:hypothetical protein